MESTLKTKSCPILPLAEAYDISGFELKKEMEDFFSVMDGRNVVLSARFSRDL